MAKEVVIKPAGLWTAGNAYEAPPGAMTEATNVVITDGGLLQTRNGYYTTPSSHGGGSAFWVGEPPVNCYIRNYQNTRRQYASAADGKLWGRTSLNWYNLGTAEAEWPQESIKYAEAKQNLYVACSTGVLRVASALGSLTLSGIPKPLSLTLSTAGTTGGWLTSPGSVAYRAVLKFEDANSNVYLSAPSSRAVYRNSGGTTLALAVAIRLPSGLSDAYSIQVYRSRQTSSASDEPSDEMGLVYERPLTAAEATAQSVSITNNDIVPDVMRGGTGYFCPSQDGILGSNERPPLANDIAWFKDCMFFANTTSKHRLTLRLLSVGASYGLQNNDTVTIAGTAYTAKTTPGAAPEFGIVTSYASPQLNIQATTQNLVTAINTAAANTSVYAYVLSGPDDPAGIFMLEERAIGGAAFVAISSRATCWAPELPSSGDSVISDNEAKGNRIYISKALEPEAVPLLSYLDVGTEGPILRVMATRDSLFVFKSAGGIWRIVGDGPGSFRALPVDLNVSLGPPDTLAATGNKLRFLGPLGFYEVSEAGCEHISGPIDDLLWADIVSTTGATVRNFAIGHERLGLYICWIASGDDDGFASEAYVYNTKAAAWTKWALPAYGAAYSALEHAYVVGSEDNTVSLEMAWPANVYASVTREGSIPVATTFALKVAGNPAALKEWSRLDVLQQGATVTAITAGFTTDLDTSEDTVSLAPTAGQKIIACPIPQAKQLGSNLVVSLDADQEDKKFSLAGFVLTYSDVGDVGTR
jgi:hypothetical protein